MNLTIKTDTFKEMVARSTKGASCNKIMPITGMMAIQLSKNVLTLITSDASNYLYIRKDKVEGEDFYVTVPVEKFSKLIARMTCETITLELKENVLEVSGNGKYLIELPDEEGELIKYPDPLAEVSDPSNVGEIKATMIQHILNAAKPSLAKTMEVPCYTGYYVGDKVVSTDTCKMCIIKEKVFDNAYLIGPEMMDLLAVMTAEKISVDGKDNILIFSSPDCVIYGPIMDGIEDFDIEAIEGFINSFSTGSVCKVPKAVLLQLLDRLSLFVNDFDEGAIYLTFTKEGLMVRSKSESSTEIIPYSASENFKDFACALDITDLVACIKAQASDAIEIQYGTEDNLKIVDGNTIQAICFIDEEDAGE